MSNQRQLQSDISMSQNVVSNSADRRQHAILMARSSHVPAFIIASSIIVQRDQAVWGKQTGRISDITR